MNASISGTKMGCQDEMGVACLMTSDGLTELIVSSSLGLNR